MSGVRHPTEVRDGAIRIYLEEKVSAAVVAGRLGLQPFTVKDWLRARKATRSMSEAAALSVSQQPRGIRGVHIEWRSAKTGRTEIADSTYEAARMAQLDADADVVDWWRCSDRVAYTAADGRARSHVPDLVVVRKDGRRVVEEIKPERFILAGDNPAKFAAARLHYGRLAIGFEIITEEVIGRDRTSNHEVYRPDKDAARLRHNAKVRESRARREAAETDEQRRARLDWAAARRRCSTAARKLGSPETIDQAVLRRRKQRAADERLRANETDEQRSRRLALKAARAREARATSQRRNANVNTVPLTVTA